MTFRNRDDLEAWMQVVVLVGSLDLACHFQAALDGVAEDRELVEMLGYLWEMLAADNLPEQGRVSAQRIMDELLERYDVEQVGRYLKVRTRKPH